MFIWSKLRPLTFRFLWQDVFEVYNFLVISNYVPWIGLIFGYPFQCP